MKYAQLQRFKIIDRALYMNPEGMSTSRLTELINEEMARRGANSVSLRQVQADIKDMKTLLDAPVSSARGQRCVKYDNMMYCAFKTTYDEYEDEHPSVERKMKGRMAWIKLWVELMQDSKVSDTVAEAVEFDDNLDLHNISFIPQILNAIVGKHVLFIGYEPGFGERNYYTVHPYFIKQYEGRWYLFAYNEGGRRRRHTMNGIQTFSIDRINSLERDKSTVYRPIPPDKLREYKRAYFSDIVGVARINENSPKPLTLDFKYDAGDDDRNKTVRKFYKLLESNPFYPGFKFSESKSGGKASAVIRRNYELENNLLMYAHAARISDAEIREAMVKRARRILYTQLNAELE